VVEILRDTKKDLGYFQRPMRSDSATDFLELLKYLISLLF